MSDKKMGRPTINPRKHKISLRITEDDLRTVEDYCKRKSVSRTDAIIDGIRLLKEKK